MDGDQNHFGHYPTNFKHPMDYRLISTIDVTIDFFVSI
jgi:hypothetical protein